MFYLNEPTNRFYLELEPELKIRQCLLWTGLWRFTEIKRDAILKEKYDDLEFQFCYRTITDNFALYFFSHGELTFHLTFTFKSFDKPIEVTFLDSRIRNSLSSIKHITAVFSMFESKLLSKPRIKMEEVCLD